MSTRPLEASRPRQIRKTKLVDSSLQLRIVGAFLAVACVAALFQVLLTNHSMMGIVRNSPTAGDQLLAHIPGLLVRNLAITLGVLAPITLAVGVLVTHRIAGPVFSMERHLRKIADGKRPEAGCRLRDGDSMSDLCRAMNAAVARLSGEDLESVSEASDASAKLEEVSSLVSESDDPQEESVPAASEPEAEAETD